MVKPPILSVFVYNAHLCFLHCFYRLILRLYTALIIGLVCSLALIVGSVIAVLSLVFVRRSVHQSLTDTD